MLFSIIVVSHGHDSDLRCLLDSLKKHFCCDHELILIDNIGSEKDLIENMLEGCFENYKLVRNVAPLSFSINNNVGASLASGDVLIFLNPDILLFDDSLFNYLVSTDIGDGLYFPRLINFDGTPQVHGKAKPSFINQLVTFIASVMSIKRESPAGEYWYFAAAMVVKRRFFYALGGFDVNFPMYGEDTELCDRARRRGFKVGLIQGVFLKHGLGGDSKKKYLWRAVRSNLYLRYKMLKNYLNRDC